MDARGRGPPLSHKTQSPVRALGSQGHRVGGGREPGVRGPRRNAGLTLWRQRATEGVEKVIWRLQPERQDRLWTQG